MQQDLLTLYGLAIGTLLVCAGMTLWERHVRPERAAELGAWAAGYALLAAGCGLAITRPQLPWGIGWALSNTVILSGYSLVLIGVARLEGRRYGRAVIALLVFVAAAWMVGGDRTRTMFWNYGSGVPIALVSGMTTWRLLHSRSLRPLRSLPVAAAITGLHAAFYLARALLLPVFTAKLGDGILPQWATWTLYEGVLYSVALPMALLSMVREEAQGELLAASRTDYLTGLGNRQRLFEEGSAVLARGGPVSLLAFDLDYFKSINDRFGHAAGDEVLRSFARIARETAGSASLLARLGGEEFVALLPGRDGPAARRLGQAIAQRFAAAVHGDGEVRATVSVGLAELGTDGADLPALLAAADRAVYSAKALGRNRVEVARRRTLAATS